MIQIKKKIRLTSSARGRKRIDRQPVSEDARSRGRVPRISRLMALAIRFNRVIREGIVTDQTELAHLVHVSQPRVTQIMNLLNLAPDIQEELLFLPQTLEGKAAINERQLRPITAEVSWQRQRNEWRTISDRQSG